MIFNHFWENWADITELEHKYIYASKLFFTNFTKTFNLDKISSVYFGGSFARRDLENYSDIDVYIIISDNKNLDEFIDLCMEKIIIDGISFGCHVFSFQELEDNDFHGKYGWKIGRAHKPEMFLNNLNDYELVYGSLINQNEFKHVFSDEENLKKELDLVKYFMAEWDGHLKKQLRTISKTIFYIVHYETRIKLNEEFNFHRTKLLNRFVDKNDHIIHLCNDIRKHTENYLDKSDDVFRKVNDYVNFVEKNYFKL